MIDRRIRIPKGCESVIEQLLNDKENDLNGPFPNKAAVIAFAAALGSSKGPPEPFSETTGEPIRKSVFMTGGYDALINLLAISESRDPNILADTDEMEDRRATIFEGYAHRGLQILRSRLSNSLDHLDEIIFCILENRSGSTDFIGGRSANCIQDLLD